MGGPKSVELPTPPARPLIEQYSKEFWRVVGGMHPMFLSGEINRAFDAHRTRIRAWAEGTANFEQLVGVDYTPGGKEMWIEVPVNHHRWHAGNTYREAQPKPIERDVVVYWRDALTHTQFRQPAGIDVRLLWPEGTHEKAKTLAQLEADIPGFKLLSITRVVVDPTNHNLMDYTTKLENLGRVPF